MTPQITTPMLFGIGAFLLMPLGFLVMTGIHDVTITCSLYHNATLDEWWPQNSWKFPNITIEEFREFPFPNGLTQIDGKFVNATPEDIQVGDIMVFRTLSDPPIIGHRVIRKWSFNGTEIEKEYVDGFPSYLERNVKRYYFSTVGDNWFQQPFERKLSGAQIAGKLAPRNSHPVFPRLFGRLRCRSA